MGRSGGRFGKKGRTYSTDDSWLSKALRLLIAERRCSVKDAGVKRSAPVRKSVTGKFLAALRIPNWRASFTTRRTLESRRDLNSAKAASTLESLLLKHSPKTTASSMA